MSKINKTVTSQMAELVKESKTQRERRKASMSLSLTSVDKTFLIICLVSIFIITTVFRIMAIQNQNITEKQNKDLNFVIEEPVGETFEIEEEEKIDTDKSQIIVNESVTDSVSQVSRGDFERETTKPCTFDMNDFIDLCSVVYAESGITRDEAQIITCSVVINRHQQWRKTIHDTIFAKGQYSVTWNGAFDNAYSVYSSVLSNIDQDFILNNVYVDFDGNGVEDNYERVYRNCREVYLNGSNVPSNVLYQANFKQGSGVYRYIDNLYFCYV